MLKNFARILSGFLKKYFIYNVEIFIPRRMSEDDKITFAIKYLPRSHWVMMSSIT